MRKDKARLLKVHIYMYINTSWATMSCLVKLLIKNVMISSPTSGRTLILFALFYGVYSAPPSK